MVTTKKKPLGDTQKINKRTGLQKKKKNQQITKKKTAREEERNKGITNQSENS